jgi:hypothetical protein
MRSDGLRGVEHVLVNVRATVYCGSRSCPPPRNDVWFHLLVAIVRSSNWIHCDELDPNDPNQKLLRNPPWPLAHHSRLDDHRSAILP